MSATEINCQAPSDVVTTPELIASLKALTKGNSYVFLTNVGSVRVPHWVRGIRQVVAITRASVTVRDPSGEFTGTAKHVFKRLGNEGVHDLKLHSVTDLS